MVFRKRDCRRFLKKMRRKSLKKPRVKRKSEKKHRFFRPEEGESRTNPEEKGLKKKGQKKKGVGGPSKFKAGRVNNRLRNLEKKRVDQNIKTSPLEVSKKPRVTKVGDVWGKGGGEKDEKRQAANYPPLRESGGGKGRWRKSRARRKTKSRGRWGAREGKLNRRDLHNLRRIRRG